MHLSPYFSSLLLIPFTLVRADANSTIASLEAQINPCTEACAAAAISKSVCGLTDFTCQCQHATELNAVIVPSFESISVQICSVLGVTITGSSPAPTGSGASSISSKSAAITTATTNSSGSASASASGSTPKQAGAASALDVNLFISENFAIVGAGLMAMFL